MSLVSDRASKARKKAGLAASKKLAAAADAVCAYARACANCGDASAPRGPDDSRYQLAASMREYQEFLARRFEVRP